MPGVATGGGRAAELTARLSPAEEGLLSSLREVKNQIIGNRTKKLLYLSLGAVPRIVAVFAAALDCSDGALIAEQSAVAIGSFAYGVEDGARAVLDAGAVPHLVHALSNPNFKVVDAAARSLRIIFQSKIAPKFDVLEENNITFLLTLLSSDNENVTELAASIVAYSCGSTPEQKALCTTGVLKRLFSLLEGSLNRRDAILESIAAVIKSNHEVSTEFASFGNGKALDLLVESIRDRYPRTRLLACMCLNVMFHAASDYLQHLLTQTKMLKVLVELLEEPDQVGDDAPFVLLDLISGKEELHKQAILTNAVGKLCSFLELNLMRKRRLQGILLALAEFCSKLEKCRFEVMSSQVLNVFPSVLKHDCVDIRIAACICLQRLSRSVQNLSAGSFSIDTVVVPLVQLLDDHCLSVQVAALGVIANIAVDFKSRKPLFVESGCMKKIIQLSKSMDAKLRLNAVRALRNLVFLADCIGKETILQDLTTSTLSSLICDSEASIQEQALALAGNLVDGSGDTITRLFFEDGLILSAVIGQLDHAPSPAVSTQGMLFLSNVAASDEFHGEAVMGFLVPPVESRCTPFLIDFLQNKDSSLRTAAVWCIINLTYLQSLNSSSRIARLQDAGIISQLKSMINDPCLDAKFRVRLALEQCTVLERS